MKKKDKTLKQEDVVGCCGDYFNDVSLCRKTCILSIHCMIAKERDVEMEIMEDFFYGDAKMMVSH
ncbi:MAG: hypothetical protein HQK77_10605 [Desulfobacterales bacterium]|nr:hypothetical protein [Desulfobacterales bacterium]